MSELKLKEINDVLQKYVANGTIVPNDNIEVILALVKTLTDQKANLKIEFEKQKANVHELQKKVRSSYNQLQSCSTEEVPALKKKVKALERQVNKITNEINVTKNLVIPLREVVAKSRDELRKCLAREKEVIASINVSVPDRLPWIDHPETEALIEKLSSLVDPEMRRKVWYDLRESIFTNLTTGDILLWDHSTLETMSNLLDEAFEAKDGFGFSTPGQSDKALQQSIVFELHDFMQEAIGDEGNDYLRNLDQEDLIKHIQEYQEDFDPLAIILQWSDIYDAELALFYYAIELQYIENN